MKFEDYRIAPELKKALAKAGFRRPTDIQFKAIPSILKGEDVLAIAQTGTGKTAAFAIPILNIVHQKKQRARRKDGIKCLVMVPTHELALQVAEVFIELGKYTQVKTYALIGGVDQDPQISQLEEGVDILVSTPGRMFDLRSQGHLRLNRVETLILDEADHMLDLGFIKDIRDIMYHLPKKRQTLFFSATINHKIKRLAYSLVTNAIRIQLSPRNPVTKNVHHSVLFVEMDDKRFFLERLINEHPGSKIMVFVRTKVRAERVCKALERMGIEGVQTMHGDKTQEDRAKILESFKQGECSILIATDISARGIDVDSVDYVINYDLPTEAENYVHRIGRTGRGAQRGYAVSFCSTEEKEMLTEIEKFLGDEIEVLRVDNSTYFETVELTKDNSRNWQALIKEEMRKAEELKEPKKKKRRKKK